MMVSLDKKELEMITRALYVLADTNLREARSHRFVGKHFAPARKSLREDAANATQLATVLYATMAG